MKSIARQDLTPGTTIHTFEAAGLGKAPYKFLGVQVFKFKAAPDAPTQPGTSCDYCGTAIMNAFILKSADGKEFKVGCDCILKTGDKGLRKVISQVEKEKRQKKADERRKKDQETRTQVWNELKELLTDGYVVEALKARPHPSIPSYNLLNYVEWNMIYAGIRGLLNVLNIVKGIK